MTLSPFILEEYLAQYEFTAPYLLCCSDTETYGMDEIVQMASPEERTLWGSLRLSYTEPNGHPLLRQQIVESFYPTLSPENILCFAGAEEGIFSALHTVCEPGDHVIVLGPCYQSLMEIPKFRGASVTTLFLREENQWRIDIDAIKKAIQPNTKCLVMNFPHNPTGQVIRPDELSALIQLLDHHGIWLFSDEVYRLLGSPKEGWAEPAASHYPRAISLGVMSKSFGMAGLRVGWIACQDKVMLEKISGFKHYLSICNSAPAEILSLIALRNKEAILKRNNEIVAGNIALLDDFFQNDLFSWVRPEGGCVGFVNYKSDTSVDNFCAKLVDKKGVLLLPASVYNYPSNHFRIGFGRKNMTEALLRLESFLIS